MRYILNLILALLCSVLAVADVMLSSESVCEKFIRTQTREDCEACAAAQTESTIPEYYCDCQLGSKFVYGMDTTISSTTWFQSTIGEIAYTGMTAYWFSTGSATLSIYTSCLSQAPIMTLTVYSYRSESFDSNGMVQMMEKYGFSPSLYSFLPVYIKVTPKGDGRVLGYEYGEGFHSDCDDMFQLYYGMRLYHSNDTDVYELPASRIVPQFFVRWRQENQDSVWVSMMDNCDGENVLESAVLTDSMHLYFPDSTKLKQLKAENKSAYFRFVSKSRKGRIEFIRPSRFEEATENINICYGSSYELNGKKYEESAVIKDTTFLVSDTCLVTTYKLQVSSQQTKKETIQLLQSEFDKGYKFHDWYLIKKWGQDECVEQDDQSGCITHYQLNVVQKWNWHTTTIEETLCHGKTYQSENGKVKLTETATVRDTIKTGDDAYVTVYKITFTAPEPEADIIYCEQLPCNYSWKGNAYKINHYGDTVLLYTARNKCDEAIRVSVVNPVVTTDDKIEESGWKVVPTISSKGEPIRVIIPQGGVLTVMDILGRIVYTSEVERGELVLPQLQTGQYLVRLQTTNERYNNRIIIK